MRGNLPVPNVPLTRTCRSKENSYPLEEAAYELLATLLIPQRHDRIDARKDHPCLRCNILTGYRWQGGDSRRSCRAIPASIPVPGRKQSNGSL